MRERHALARQSVEGRRPDVGIAREAKRLRSPLIGEDEQNIGRLVLGRLRIGRGVHRTGVNRDGAIGWTSVDCDGVLGGTGIDFDGVLAGAGIGLGYASASPPAIKWFPPQKKGLIVGIVVGVALDTMRQMEAQLLMRHYEGFLK